MLKNSISYGHIIQVANAVGSYLVGLVYVDQPGLVEEGKGYFLALKNESFISLKPILQEQPENPLINTVSEAMKEPIWADVSGSDTFVCRLLKNSMHPNAFVIYAASQSEKLTDVEYREITISNQAITMEPVSDKMHDLLIGESPTSLLRKPIWYNSDSELFALEAMSQKGLELYFNVTKLQASLVRGEITEAQFESLVYAEGGYYHPDPIYMKYVEKIDELGLLDEWHDHLSIDDYEERNFYLNQVVEGLNS